jgi:hypothetical protein
VEVVLVEVVLVLVVVVRVVDVVLVLTTVVLVVREVEVVDVPGCVLVVEPRVLVVRVVDVVVVVVLGRVLVVVDDDAPVSQEQSVHEPPPAQSATVSHSSPPSTSTRPSPHAEASAAMRWRFVPRAVSVPARVVHDGSSILAFRRTLRSVPHVAQRTEMLLEVARRLTFARAGPHPLAMVAFDAASTTMASNGSAVPGTSAWSTRKRTPGQGAGATAAAGAAAATSASATPTAQRASIVELRTAVGRRCAAGRGVYDVRDMIGVDLQSADRVRCRRRAPGSPLPPLARSHGAVDEAVHYGRRLGAGPMDTPQANARCPTPAHSRSWASSQRLRSIPPA